MRSVAHQNECNQSEAIGALPQGSVGILILSRVGAQEVTQEDLDVTKTAARNQNDFKVWFQIFFRFFGGVKG